MAYDNVFTGSGYKPLTHPLVIRKGVGSGTLAGNLVLTHRDAQFLSLDPGGASRDVTLPAGRDGALFTIYNAADADDEDLVVKNPAAATIHTITRGQWVMVGCEGSTWRLLGTSQSPAGLLDLDGLADGLVLDADGDTTISAPTDDQIDIEIAGADDFRFIANLFQVLAGSAQQFLGAGTGVGAILARLGASINEGVELVQFEDVISPAAVETAIVTVPKGAVILGVQANCESALTGGGTTVTWSIGTAGDPDKYGTAGNGAGDTLAQNGKLDYIPDWAVLGAAEPVVLTGAATGGAADGDTALTVGSVRARVTYLQLNSLDDA